ncbi:Golgi apyrase [Ceratocystis fimbriata CBS 114723]|uniref:Golgi apyrase n=1 Tax=Ceratocystis fimbriata CBS 114723 TaxID=1035309 RepID=A0A2C5XG89_9PEZI|nr:Golgi apyrase [Ceratocystis fimbriata CBS 114723]
MGKHSRYGVIFDAGSSGTRVYVYKWKDAHKDIEEARKNHMNILPKIKIEESKKVHPGVSSFAETPTRIGPDHLKALVDVALSEIPKEKVSGTPVYLMATAGMRLLPEAQQKMLLSEMCSYFQKHTEFSIGNCTTQFQVIPGETEGLYGWIAANYLLGGFDPKENAGTNSHNTYGFLDMGGASAQIAFAPNATEAEKHANDLKLVRFRTLDGNPLEYKVFTTTWLGFGANKARDRYIEQLVSKYEDHPDGLPDPCLPKGLRMTPTGQILSSDKSKPSGAILLGTGDFKNCLAETQPLLEKDAPCPDQPCLINGQHVPAIDFDVNHFVGVSEYWHTTHGVFGTHDGDKDEYDFATYQDKVNKFCSQDWADIQNLLQDRSKSIDEKAQDALQACFKASWLINVLYEGIGIPRVGLEQSPHNVSIDPFQPVNKIDGAEVSWTMGKMLLYASGQIPSSDPSALPVGFGSNEAGIPTDFEYAGSVEDEAPNDKNNLVQPPSQSFSSILLFILVIIALLLCLRKRDYRARIFTFCQGLFSNNRLSSPRKALGPGTSFIRRLLRTNSVPYERVLEEADLDDFELADTDGNDSDASVSSLSRGPSSLPRINLERQEGSPAARIDRRGMAVRTESREQLALPQMLNAGRRSRTGSPTRNKSPLAD